MKPDLLKDIPTGKIKPEREAQLTKVIFGSASKKLKNVAREELVIHTMHEAFLYARECAKGGLPEDEIFSLSYKALSSAVGNFRKRPGVQNSESFRFFAYVKPYLRGEVMRSYRRLRVVRGGDAEATTCLIPAYARICLAPEELRIPSDFDSAVSAPVPKVGFEGETEIDFSAMDTALLWEKVKPLLESRLTPQAQEALKLHFYENKNFQEIADKMGFARQYAQRLVKESLEKLRCLLSHQKALFVDEHFGS